MVQKQSKTRASGADISTTGVVLRAETPGDALVSLNIDATADASYALDVSPTGDPQDWFEAEETYAAADVDDLQDIRDTFVAGDAYIRVRVTSAAAAGETADITIQQAH
ncbi:hypothetical protein [Haloarcula argentinensis]|uniref:hypothetical protein n=1 Tax=Haloarcula argentinensis TaxID=43776 RepID=UPI0002AF63CA|nr:hypothetical protein [Haloarcula argentinensis]EMA19012.1 hypothetical protein C443_17918 [Haloarcula argentinensis DSM 12282]